MERPGLHLGTYKKVLDYHRPHDAALHSHQWPKGEKYVWEPQFTLPGKAAQEEHIFRAQIPGSVFRQQPRRKVFWRAVQNDQSNLLLICIHCKEITVVRVAKIQ